MLEPICSENKDQGSNCREKGIVKRLKIFFYTTDKQQNKSKRDLQFCKSPVFPR